MARKANITKSVKLSHSLADVVASAHENVQRILLAAAYSLPSDGGGKISLKLGEVSSLAGSHPRALYKTALLLEKELRGLSYYVVKDSTKFLSAGVVQGDISFDEGELSFEFTPRAVAEIRDIKTRYTLVHLLNVRRCRGRSMVALYLALAQWDSRGWVDLRPKDFSSSTARNLPALFTMRTIAPFVELFNELADEHKIHLNLKFEVEGKGQKTTWKFTWNQESLGILGEDKNELPNMKYDAESKIRMNTEMLLRKYGVWDKNIYHKLFELPAQVAWEAVVQCGEDAPGKPGVIHTLIMGKIFEWLSGSTPEQIAARRKDAQVAREVIEVEAKAEADNELSKVAAWLANVSDDTLIAAAGRLEPYEWELIARMKPPKDIGKVLPKLRELAAKSEWLASALAVKAGVVVVDQ